jgi:hypothetical protein
MVLPIQAKQGFQGPIIASIISTHKLVLQEIAHGVFEFPVVETNKRAFNFKAIHYAIGQVKGVSVFGR